MPETSLCEIYRPLLSDLERQILRGGKETLPPRGSPICGAGCAGAQTADRHSRIDGRLVGGPPTPPSAGAQRTLGCMDARGVSTSAVMVRGSQAAQLRPGKAAPMAKKNEPRIIRTMGFVPAHEEDKILASVDSGLDAIGMDMEDLTPRSGKQ